MGVRRGRRAEDRIREFGQRVPGGGLATGGIFLRVARVVVRRPLIVIGFWVVLAAVLSVTFPPLTRIVGERSEEILPTDAPVNVAARHMSESFHEPVADNVALVVLTDEHALTPGDEDVYRALVDTLRRDTRDVAMVQDFITTPALREVMASKDNQAWFIPVTLATDITSAKSNEAYARVAKIVKQTVAGPTLTAHITGPPATGAELLDSGERDLHVIEIATIVMVLLILLVVYRNPVTMLLPLLTIGLSLVTAQQVVAGLAGLGLGISQQTVVFMVAMMIGAGVDYAVFLISRYHEYLRHGLDSDQAIARALAGIGKVIAASAATVAVTFLGMTFTRLPVFSTVGPALAISIAVAFLAAVTFLPAIMVLAGRRGWIAPRRDLTSRLWRRSGIHIVRRPASHLAVSLVILIVLASCARLARYSYDARTTLPPSAQSNIGYAALDRHFPASLSVPQYLYVRSPHDMSSPRGLADLEQMAQRVSQLPDIALVRGITRPTGEPLEQAKLSYQAGEVGSKLAEASSRIADANGDLDALTSGARRLADTLAAIRSQVSLALGGLNGLADRLAGMRNQLDGAKTLQEIDALVGSMRSSLNSIATSVGSFDDMLLDMAGSALAELNTSPTCADDPACRYARDQLQRLVDARNRRSLDRIADLARQLQSTPSVQYLAATLRGLRASLNEAVRTIHALGLDNPGFLQQQLATMEQGANALADGSRRVADGVRALTDQTKELGGGLSDAAAFLLSMKLNASQPGMAGFYIPPQVMTEARFKDVAAVFMSHDGVAARYLVQSKLDPFDPKAMDQVKSILASARSAQPNTTLADASISMTGLTPFYTEMRDYYNHDLRFIVLMTVAVVLLILILLLRAVLAPLYLVGTVILSYLSALGTGAIVFQLIGGQPLGWSVPGMTFIVLVAVGADYNMLLISRIRDESPDGIRPGVIRTVGTTGGVITSAGVIFAASMLGLLFASTSTMVQPGLIIGVGLLLDTFLVRTMTVPSLAVLVGKGNWWPSGWRPKRRRSRRPKRARLGRSASDKVMTTYPPDPVTVAEPADQAAVSDSSEQWTIAHPSDRLAAPGAGPTEWLWTASSRHKWLR